MNTDKIKLLILFGGPSLEHEVSCMSTASVLNNINKEKYEIRTVGITKEGIWYLTEATPEEIGSGKWNEHESNEEGSLLLSRNPKGFKTSSGTLYDLDCIFPIMHGKYCEDGAIQGVFEMAGIPYVGSKVLGSAIGMDKIISKLIVSNTDIVQAEYCYTDRYDFSSSPLEVIKEIETKLNYEYPFFVKPANTGSSVGITMVNSNRELFEGIKRAAEIDHRILIEKGIKGREIEVAVLGNRKPKASLVGEIIAANEFYDYDAKYNNGASLTKIVDDLPDSEIERIRNTAVEIYKLFSCRGFSRVDFFYTDNGEIVFNEINTIPGFTKISMYPKLWEATGIQYNGLIDKLIELAMEEF
ncbi:MAG: D-alanine--D-alanine ligase family protein [Anaerovoracaceae bacterium]